MTENWTVEDFGKFEAFLWEDKALTLLGYPSKGPDDTLQNRLMRLQLDRGFKGTQLGGGADGLQGAKTLAILKSAFGNTPTQYNIDLSLWKWTSPIWNADRTSPLEVYPLKADFQMAPWFERTARGSIMLSAKVGGAHTPNSLKTRSEFREMNRDGTRAKWDSEDGKLRMLTGSLRIHEMPDEIPSVVFGQYHDGDDDVFMLNAVGNADRNYASIKLLQSLGPGQGSIPHLLDSSYRLGDILNYRMEMGRGGFKCIYKNVTKEIEGEWEDVYRKAGLYNQSDPNKGEDPDEISRLEYLTLGIFDL